MNSLPTLHGWIDESMHTASSTLSEGIYLLAATVADVADCETVRDVLRLLRLGNGPKLHWKDENPSRRRYLATALSELDLKHTVVVGAPLDPRRQERARRLCMERLLHELCMLGVSRVWAESRTSSLNRRDVQMIDALRSRQVIPAGLTLEFALPSIEPMLWSPDIVAGAAGLHRRLGDPAPFDALESRVVVHDLRI